MMPLHGGTCMWPQQACTCAPEPEQKFGGAKITAIWTDESATVAAAVLGPSLGERATDAEILEDLRDQIANSGDC